MVNKITAAELANMQARGSAQLIDICSSTEYASGHVPGATNIPIEQIGAHIADLRIGAPLVLICKSGQRASATAQLLKPAAQMFWFWMVALARGEKVVGRLW